MSLATDILKRSGLAPLSPRVKTQIYKRRRNALYPEIQARRKAVRACGFQNGKAVNLGEFKTQELIRSEKREVESKQQALKEAFAVAKAKKII